VGRALNSLGSSRQVRRERLELETWSTNPNFPALKLETGRVTYLLLFYLDSASNPIFVSRRDAIRVGRIETKDHPFHKCFSLSSFDHQKTGGTPITEGKSQAEGA